MALWIPAALLYVLYLDWRVTSQFEGKRWALPARVYARPLELYEGLRLSPQHLEAELRLLGYQRHADIPAPGSYERLGDIFRLRARPFVFPEGEEPTRIIEIRVGGNQITRLRGASGEPLDLARLDPVLIGSIYPAHREDRVLVRLEDVPPLLIKALIELEDRRFHEHHGVSLIGIGRALLSNLQAGRVVQGGSTITQQLVKNFYLTGDRTIWRKANEAVMAVLLDYHYSKDEILEAYLNEIYLGQDGNRSIHGFGMASQFYFGRPLQELQPHQLALLTALVKGASYYDPRRHPERAMERRNLVLKTLGERKVLPMDKVHALLAQGLDVTARGRSGDSPYPAFMDLVKEHLHRDYRPEDLSSEGLRVFTTLAPDVQESAEQALVRGLKRWSNANVQGAAVILNVDDASVLAVVSGREPKFPGFNRALYARRPIGSLIKPAVYLAALEHPDQYGLGTLVEDEPISLTDANGSTWIPKNYDAQLHGSVPLWQALANSYNLPTVRLGMTVGLRNVANVAQRLGLQPPKQVYPSFLLGAVPYSPLEVAQAYQTLASGGFRSPLRSVRSVMTRDGEVLKRYPLMVERVVEPGPAFLINYGLQRVVLEGTAKSASSRLGSDLGLAGKTGTTDDSRDSWFAGFSGNTLGVVWIGRDDNGKTGLTGATGALPVWTDLFSGLDLRPLSLAPPDGVEQLWVERSTGLLSAEYCSGSMPLPYVSGYAPEPAAGCVDQRNVFERASNWLRGFMR